MVLKMSKTFKTTLLAAAFGLTAASTATAQDWSGRYVGLHIGEADSAVDWVDDAGGWFSFVPGTSHFDEETGSVTGLHYGALYQRENNHVWGWEISFSSLDHDNTVPSPLFGSDTWRTSMDHIFAVTGRYGIAYGRWLPYLEGGIALGDPGLTNIDSGFCAPPCILDLNGVQPGLVLGIGVDFWVSDNVSVGLNYRHIAFETQTFTGVPTNRVAPETYTIGGDADVLTFRLNWMFN